MSNPFVHLELRTTDVVAAQTFYDRLPSAAKPHVTPLPKEAALRGAPSHWLGHLAVSDLARATEHFLREGAQRLGPERTSREGHPVVTLRDPMGAVVALTTVPTPHAAEGISWVQHHSLDHERAARLYVELCGWNRTGVEQVEEPFGEVVTFSWDEGHQAGCFLSTARAPSVHPHWLFAFHVSALDLALELVTKHGGEVFSRHVRTDGTRLALCHDPQGAVFALCELLVTAPTPG